jgi:hypothetical protein
VKVKKPKRKRCVVCLEYFAPFLSTQRCCDLECALIFSKREMVKKEKRETRAALVKLRSRRDWVKLAQREFNAFIKARDAHLPCVSCGTTSPGKHFTGNNGWVASHYRSVGACPELRFNEDNCHKACVRCNSWLSGNIVEYRIGLVGRIGALRLADLEGPHDPKHYSIDELVRIRDEYRAKTKAAKAMSARAA